MGVKVTLQGDGLNYETVADVVQAAKIIGFLNTQEVLANEYAAVSSYQSNFLEEKKERPTSSPREAIIESGAKTNTQKITVLGKYIIERDGEDQFSSSELRTLFIKAGEPAPRNLARDIRDTVRLGYIFETSDKSDVYIVTNTGIQAISDKFASTPSKVNNRKMSKKSNSASSAKAPLEQGWLKDVSVSDQLEGFPSYRKMTTRSEKILWVIQWAATQSRKTLTGSEIVTIANKLGNYVPSKQIASAASPLLANDYVSKSSDGYSILHEGTEHLRSLNG